MTSTQSTSRADKGRLPATAATHAPSVILVEPQLAENIGTTARAMMNCGLSDLRLVDPKEDWLSERALAASSGAERVLERARRFLTTEAALADLEIVYATTARRREMIKPVMTARAAAAQMRDEIGAGRRVGLLFGRERSGLTNHEVALANVVVEVPLNPEHSSLNLAQAVLIVGYEWFQAGYDGPQSVVTYNRTRPADKETLEGMFQHLEEELIICGFLRNDDKRPSMVINIRNMLQRAELTEQEVRTLRGIVKELRYGRRPDRPKRQPNNHIDDD
ncbi:MAG: RNA methyltransferase [Rhodospirillaceae bacterium]|nr:MAG: RNA methyltransferase [Rhodospirillaceae bacterium]